MCSELGDPALGHKSKERWWNEVNKWGKGQGDRGLGIGVKVEGMLRTPFPYKLLSIHNCTVCEKGKGVRGRGNGNVIIERGKEKKKRGRGRSFGEGGSDIDCQESHF